MVLKISRKQLLIIFKRRRNIFRRELGLYTVSAFSAAYEMLNEQPIEMDCYIKSQLKWTKWNGSLNELFIWSKQNSAGSHWNYGTFIDAQ